jgi:hypothetical protein
MYTLPFGVPSHPMSIGVNIIILTQVSKFLQLFDTKGYIAEFWNSLSSTSMIFWGFVGVLYTVKLKLERRFIVAFLFLALVGKFSDEIRLVTISRSWKCSFPCNSSIFLPNVR